MGAPETVPDILVTVL